MVEQKGLAIGMPRAHHLYFDMSMRTHGLYVWQSLNETIPEQVGRYRFHTTFIVIGFFVIVL